MTKNKVKTYGSELEKVVSNKTTKRSHKTSQDFFKGLQKLAKKRKATSHIHVSDLNPTIIIGTISNDLGEQGIDNGFNLLETASAVHTSLSDLKKSQFEDLKSTLDSLENENATILNSSIHPTAKRDMGAYKNFVAPKGVYPYIWYRGWNHAAGIDARAQNSPATGVGVGDAARAVTAIIGIGAATIALTANSPITQGRISKYKEARLKIWDDMFHNSKVRGDFFVSKFPPKPFENLGEYFSWMFGKKTAIHFAVQDSTDGYKGLGEKILIPERFISVLDFLKEKSVTTYNLHSLFTKFPPTPEIITPNITHMESMQWAQFAGARIRFKLKDHDSFPVDEFVHNCLGKSTEVEEIFKKFTEFVYIEGRDPGANFPDQKIGNAGSNVAESVMIAPSALQAGIINNLDKVSSYLATFEWKDLGLLREESIRNGLQGEHNRIKVHNFTEKILELASDGLDGADKKHLAYFEWVLKTGKNGADRAIESFRKSNSDSDPMSQFIEQLEVAL